jgi:hypothetical protein
MWGGARPCVGVGARVEAREELRVICGSWARAEERAHQPAAMAGGGRWW